MTDAMFNELLDREVREVAAFYLNETHYEPAPFIRIHCEAAPGLVVNFKENLNPGDTDLTRFLRKHGARYGLKHPKKEPTALFVIQVALALQIGVAGPPKPPLKVITIHGITNDARFNLVVLEAQMDEDGRLYLVPLEVHHYPHKLNVQVDILPYMPFFDTNSYTRQKIGAVL